ncbi:MAG: 3'(2'),5'-bisphosphate nucleotidase CysQ [Desulfobacterales bacterium]|nr:3'(2'),5'-bisphosphate nucleotidase CysQ [Desulfobacterales bacterium]
MTEATLIIQAVRAAIGAGTAILEVYHGDDFHVERKADDSPLTLADTRSHEIIVSYLGTSAIPILSEEGIGIPYGQRKAWNRLWIVDPLDGTREFIKRNGEFTVNIALVENGLPVFGVVSVPDRNVLYVGERKLGAFQWNDLNRVNNLLQAQPSTDAHQTVQLLISEAQRLPERPPAGMVYTVVGSRSHLTEEVEDFVEQKRREHGQVDFVSAGSSLKFCLVAEGKAHIYPRLGPTMEWDTAAGQAVVQAAGGGVVRHDTGTPLTYNKEDLLNPWFIVQSRAASDWAAGSR